MIAITRYVLALSLSLITAIVAAEDINTLIKNPARAYGYTIGDVLNQTIALHDGETKYTVQTLPLTQREGRWVTRQSVELHPNGQQLNIRYQIVNSPTSTRLIALPALTLNTEQGTSIDVPAWPFSVAPLTPVLPDAENTLPGMQADWKSELPSSTALWRNIKALLVALLLTLLLWLAWWIMRGLREANTLPFAKAYRTINQYKKSQYKNDSTRDDAAQWLALHRAFDQKCGRRVGGGSIGGLISSADWLVPFESDIRTFYEISSERFFAIEESQVSFDLFDLSKRLYKAERRNTSKLNQPSQTAQDTL